MELFVVALSARWAPRPRVDNSKVKALARAFRWRGFPLEWAGQHLLFG